MPKKQYVTTTGRPRPKGRASQQSVLDKLKSDEVLDHVGNAYGNLKVVDEEVLERKRRFLTTFLDAIANDLQFIVAEAVKQYPIEGDVPITLTGTIGWCEFIKVRRDFISLHPHLWMREPMFDNLQKLKERLIEINKRTNESLASRDVEKFKQWENAQKYILPSIVDEFNFHDVEKILPTLFNAIVRLDFTVANVIREIVYPPYDWNAALDLKLEKMASRVSGAMGRTVKCLKSQFEAQLPTMYMRKLGLTQRGIDWINLTTKSMIQSEKEKEELSLELKETFLGSRHPQLRKIAEDTFGAEALQVVAESFDRDAEAEADVEATH